jgi:hypothetical protein
MRSKPSDPLSDCSRVADTATLLAGLLQLLKAAIYARELGRSTWDFAVEMENLHTAGLTSSELRWLACKGYVDHAVETTPTGSETRSFEREGRLTFSSGTCFVLTERGAEFVRAVSRYSAAGPETASMTGKGAVPWPGPRWDSEYRVLWVGGQVVKRFQVPAGNQELILTAFEELGWPTHIDDPLPPVPDLEPKRRLLDAITRLNGNQRAPLIRFHGDGKGRGIRWELRG